MVIGVVRKFFVVGDLVGFGDIGVISSYVA